MTETLDDRRRSVEDRLQAMRHAQGVAMLDGKDFDASTLQSLSGELDAITAAEGEEARRKRQSASLAEMERLTNLRATLGVVEEHRLEAVDRAEKAIRDLVEALKEVRARSADSVSIVRALGVNSMALDAYEVEHRMSLRFATALKPLVGLRRRYGQITFPEARSPYDQPWRAAEDAATTNDVSRALKGSSE